ncbi:MAG: 5-formyltetrahydrofolate cyclo-ligase [Treponema sp.]
MTQTNDKTGDAVRDAKKAMRAKMRALLRDTAAKRGAYEAASQNACSHLTASALYKNAALILAYMPLREEVDILPAIKTALREGKAVAVPKTVSGTNDMDFYLLKNTGLSVDEAEIDFDSQFERSAFGIREPKKEHSKLTLTEIRRAAEGERLLILVPALAFDFSGARLGRGKGFYDKFLFDLGRESAVTCGVCFSFQLITSVPAAHSDFSVDYVLTEIGLTRTVPHRTGNPL